MRRISRIAYLIASFTAPLAVNAIEPPTSQPTTQPMELPQTIPQLRAAIVQRRAAIAATFEASPAAAPLLDAVNQSRQKMVAMQTSGSLQDRMAASSEFNRNRIAMGDAEQPLFDADPQLKNWIQQLQTMQSDAARAANEAAAARMVQAQMKLDKANGFADPTGDSSGGTGMVVRGGTFGSPALAQLRQRQLLITPTTRPATVK